jgi:hypothetical protein
MMIEESETPDVGAQSDTTADVLAERRARHADPAVIRRAEAAEAVARNLETHLAALEQRIEEIGRERERVAQQLTERESDVRSVKQREYAEQQLRVEAEERGERLQREMRAEIQELSSRLEETERHVSELSAELTLLRERDARLTPIVRELMEVAAGLRAGFERELTTLREELQQQVVWERETYVRELTAMGARMEDLRFELTRTAADLRAQLSAEPLDAAVLQHTTEPQSEREAAHRREMADALVAAVERLRTRVAEVKEAEQAEADAQPEAVEQVEAPQRSEPEPQVEGVGHVEPPSGTEAQVEKAGYIQARPPEAAHPVEAAEQPPVEQPPAADVAWTQREPGAEPDESVIAFTPSPFLAELPPDHAPGEEPILVEPPADAAQAVEEPILVEPSSDAAQVVEPPSVVESVEPPSAVEPPVVEPAADELPKPDPLPEALAVDDAPVLDTPEEESSAEDSIATAGEASVEDQSPVKEESPVEDEPRAEGLAAPIAPAERLAPVESPVPGLGPNGNASPKAVSSGPVALQSRLLSVPEKRISWLAPAIRKLAGERDAKLAAELVIELIPAQREAVEGQLSYEIKIGELGTFYVALDPGQATISREPRGAVDFSLDGSVAAFSEVAAGGTSRRRSGLRIRKGRRAARRFLKTRRRPVALADLASAGVDVWPGLLLLAMAEAIDPSWTTGRRFELAFEIQDTADIVIYLRVCDGEPILVSRTASGKPVATISLSGHALVCLLAGTQAPAEHTTLVTGDATSVDMFLQWTARAQGLTVTGA